MAHIRCSSSSEHHSTLFAAIASKMPGMGRGVPTTPSLRICTVHLDELYFYVELWLHSEDAVRDFQYFVTAWGQGYATTHAEDAPQIPDKDDALAVYPFFRLSLQAMGVDAHMPDVLASCLRVLPLDTITALSLSADWESQTPDEPCLHPIPSAFPSITDLLYVQPAPQSLLRHLAQRSPPVFPRLKTLTLRAVYWHDHGPQCLPEMQALTRQADIEAMLDARRAMGRPLAALRLERLRNVKNADKPALEGMGAAWPEVMWDVDKSASWDVPCTTCPGVQQFGWW